MSFGEEEWEARKKTWVIQEFLDWLDEWDIALYQNDGDGGFTGQNPEELINIFVKGGEREGT
jgi:hypothetical protein